MSSNRQIEWTKGAVKLLPDTFIQDLRKTITGVEQLSEQVEAVADIAEGILNIASVFVGGGADLINELLKGLSTGLFTIIEDIKSIGGHGIVITPFNRSNKRQLSIVATPALGPSNNIAIPYTLKVPAMTAVEALKELRLAMFNDNDPMSPRWSTNIKTQGLILMANINTPTNLGSLLKILYSLFGDWSPVEKAWKDYTAYIEKTAQRHMFLSENVEKIALAVDAKKAKQDAFLNIVDSEKDQQVKSLKQQKTANFLAIKDKTSDLNFISGNLSTSLTYSEFKDLLHKAQRTGSPDLLKLNRINSIFKVSDIAVSGCVSRINSELSVLNQEKTYILTQEQELSEYVTSMVSAKEALTSTNPLEPSSEKLIIDSLLLSPDTQKLFKDAEYALSSLAIGQIVGNSPQWFGVSLASIPFLDEAIASIEKVVNTLIQSISKTSSFLLDLIKAIKGKIQLIKDLIKAVITALKAIEGLANLAEFYVVTISPEFGGREQMMLDIEASVAKAQAEEGLNPSLQFCSLMFLGWGGEPNTKAWEDLLTSPIADAEAQADLLSQSLSDLSTGVDSALNYKLPSFKISPYFGDSSTVFTYGTTIPFKVLCPGDSNKIKVYFSYELYDNSGKLVASYRVNTYNKDSMVPFDDSNLLRVNKPVNLLLQRKDNLISKIPLDEVSEFQLQVMVFAFHPITKERVSESITETIKVTREAKIQNIHITSGSQSLSRYSLQIPVSLNKEGYMFTVKGTPTPLTTKTVQSLRWRSESSSLKVEAIIDNNGKPTGSANVTLLKPIAVGESLRATCFDVNKTSTTKSFKIKVLVDTIETDEGTLTPDPAPTDSDDPENALSTLQGASSSTTPLVVTSSDTPLSQTIEDATRTGSLNNGEAVSVDGTVYPESPILKGPISSISSSLDSIGLSNDQILARVPSTPYSVGNLDPSRTTEGARDVLSEIDSSLLNTAIDSPFISYNNSIVGLTEVGDIIVQVSDSSIIRYYNPITGEWSSAVPIKRIKCLC